MRPEVRPIEFTNGHTQLYAKKKVDNLYDYKLTIEQPRTAAFN